MSEPEEPIVFWVENSTPKEIIPAVIAGIENWNIAFEEAGFKNAVVAKIQPEDATWDAADYDYNVVRWSSEPDGSLLGIGPSVSNPLTGEIISADVVNKLLAVKIESLKKSLPPGPSRTSRPRFDSDQVRIIFKF